MNVPITVRIDDNIPYQDLRPYADIKALRFAPPATNYGTWVPLLEKAFAKYRGSYGAMDLGQARDGMSVLMGLPVRQYDWSIYTSSSNY